MRQKKYTLSNFRKEWYSAAVRKKSVFLDDFDDLARRRREKNWSFLAILEPDFRVFTISGIYEK